METALEEVEALALAQGTEQRNERRLELATEGSRFFDLVRTGQAATVLASKGFTANKNEVLPIPLQELNNTKLVQNPGYN